MGYITAFELTVPNAEVYAETVKSLTGYEWYAESSDVLMMQGKWYDWASNMRDLSRDHPLVLFELNGHISVVKPRKSLDSRPGYDDRPHTHC